MKRPIDIGLIEKFDKHLKAKGLCYSASIVGGAAIMLVANEQRSTGDIDSLQRIPDEIRVEIGHFAAEHGLDATWFNDHASRNFHEFVRKGEEVYSKLVFAGDALKLFTLSIMTLLLSKIYPILDRPENPKDFQDIEDLVAAKVVGRVELEEAVGAFEDHIRFEDDRAMRKAARELSAALKKYIDDEF